MRTYNEKLNDFNQFDFSAKVKGEFRRQMDKDITHDKIESINWKAESAYFNSYHKDKTLRMPNKEWHKLTNFKYAKHENKK